jgi:DNA-binding NtrC family response regulator
MISGDRRALVCNVEILAGSIRRAAGRVRFETRGVDRRGKGKNMSDHLFALLIHSQSDPFESLKRTLGELSIETYSVSSCREAEDWISQCTPQLVFTQSSLPDGTWVSIFSMAERAKLPVSVIVVGSAPDTRLYLSVMERGAFDFVVPPFEREPMKFVVQSAAMNAHRRREASARTLVV